MLPTGPTNLANLEDSLFSIFQLIDHPLTVLTGSGSPASQSAMPTYEPSRQTKWERTCEVNLTVHPGPSLDACNVEFRRSTRPTLQEVFLHDQYIDPTQLKLDFQDIVQDSRLA
ncbi:hypothetical protein PGT21_017245 [Puccinia graminis f. sp. tritici]|uniref:Uncharacterized protein n=1 Tax=Puccinia graminis f. sp. tritici TaxID=56615 RepID=A0A5B0NUP1_PUCGR|nr:hypothetical protein PGT21_017245 [Puccinia graminis f. sp. tritici]